MYKVLLFSIIPLLLATAGSNTAAFGAEVTDGTDKNIYCGSGYYVMNGECYEMPPLVPQENMDLGIYEPQITDQKGNPIVSFSSSNFRTYVTSVIDNDGTEPHEFKLSVRYLKAEVGEWSEWKYQTSTINPGKFMTVAIPFLMADDIDNTQYQVELRDKYGIVYTFNEVIQLQPAPTPQIIPPSPIDFDTPQITGGSGGILVNNNNAAATEAKEIPSWVRSIFAFYGAGQLSDGELVEAIKFLVSTGVIAI